MRASKRFWVPAGMAAALLMSPTVTGSATADVIDTLPGGLLSNINSRIASGGSNLCGTSRLGILNERQCVVRRGGHGERTLVGPTGGVLSNLDSRQAYGGGNNCGSDTIGVLNRTTCIVR
ncbi:hypothetical protein ACQEVS_02205 [Streptomyces sp. CA-181903]|uniref:hypothetical protein n=1 Tax=Streptomyces sp. CA-181903 TaxID=3240055 RepID=UPI003D8ABF45